MARRIFAVALAICLSGWALRAAERMTLVLTDGERISGTVAFHTSTRENLIDNDFNIGIGGTEERQFHYDQVAAIDFMGGTPPYNELAALPDSGHFLVMRNGEMKRGHFVNMIGGDTLRWQDEGGGTRDMPIRDVARVYLNTQSARSTFNFRPNRGSNAQNNPGRGWAGNNQGNAYGRNFRIVGNVIVQANQPWTDSGIDVMQGDMLRFDAQGETTYVGAEKTTAAGRDDVKSSKYVIPTLGVGALIGKVGTRGTPFAIGSNHAPITVPATGRLWLGVNDEFWGDNGGNYQVTVMRGQ
jgi:hypothetical protein